jgi:asparagine synthase (glutamine-hydrolysing)
LKDILEEYIPREEFELPKKGFSVPLAKWISGGLRDDIKTRLDDEFLQSIPGLNVRKVKNQIDRHMNGGSDNSFTIWKLYVLNKWLDKNQLKF